MPIAHVIVIILVMAAWGGNFVAIKIGLDNFPPLLFSAIRFSLTAFPIIFLIGKRDAPLIAILGVGLFLGVAKFSLLFVGMDIGMPAGLSSLILQSQAFFTVLIAAALLGEKLDVIEILGLLIAASGLVLISLYMTDFKSYMGLILVIAAGFFWAISNLMMKQFGKVNMLRLIVYMSLIPPVPLFFLSWELEGSERILHAFNNLSMTSLMALLYVVVIATLIGFTIWGKMLSLYPAARVAPYGLLVPVFGMSLSAIILGERMTESQILGAALILLSLLLINSRHLLQTWRDYKSPAVSEKQ